jgi:hypothetical protein
MAVGRSVDGAIDGGDEIESWTRRRWGLATIDTLEILTTPQAATIRLRIQTISQSAPLEFLAKRMATRAPGIACIAIIGKQVRPRRRLASMLTAARTIRC